MKRNIQLKQFSLSLFIFSLLMTLFTGCDGEKDLKIIDGNLPIKTSTLFMVGDATPKWMEYRRSNSFYPKGR